LLRKEMSSFPDYCSYADAVFKNAEEPPTPLRTPQRRGDYRDATLFLGEGTHRGEPPFMGSHLRSGAVCSKL